MATDPDIHDIYVAIWTRARKEVQEADAVSFVGLSFHDYLRDGLAFLFAGKRAQTQISITDRASAQGGPYDRNSSTGRMMRILGDISVPYDSMKIRNFTDFEDFIARNM